jgi:hypothetical protein
MEHLWNDADKEKPKYFEKNLSQFSFFHNVGSNPGLLVERTPTNSLSQGTTPDFCAIFLNNLSQ